MQSKNRQARIITLIQAFDLASRISANPFSSPAQIDQASTNLLQIISSVLDAEYEQGINDATAVAIKTIRAARLS